MTGRGEEEEGQLHIFSGQNLTSNSTQSPQNSGDYKAGGEGERGHKRSKKEFDMVYIMIFVMF